MNKNIKTMITYGVVGALGFWGGILLYDFFNNDTDSIKTTSHKSVEHKNDAKQAIDNKTYKGMYSYMADANNFKLCDNGTSIPVLMQGNYLELERKYLAISQAGKEVYVELVGHLEEVETLEGDGNETAMYIEGLIIIDGGKVCN